MRYLKQEIKKRKNSRLYELAKKYADSDSLNEFLLIAATEYPDFGNEIWKFKLFYFSRAYPETWSILNILLPIVSTTLAGLLGGSSYAQLCICVYIISVFVFRVFLVSNVWDKLKFTT